MSMISYRKEREARVEALTGHRYIGPAWGGTNRAFARRDHIDVRNEEGHTLRLWRHGPMSIDCPSGSIVAQDAMFLLTGEWACPACMTMVARIRRRRGMDQLLYYADLSSGERERLDAPSSKIAMHTRCKLRSLRDDEIDLMVEEQGFHKPLADRYKDRFRSRMGRLVARDPELHGWSVTVYAATGDRLHCDSSVHVRAFRKSSKYLYLHVPMRRMFLDDSLLFRGGRFIGGIESETRTTMTAWAVKVASPLTKTAWALAHFEKNESGDWYFAHWKRQTTTTTKTKGGR